MAQDEAGAPRWFRRLLVVKLSALGALPVAAQGPKSGFREPPGTGVTDTDPTDAPGRGRGMGPRQGGSSAADPTDPPGQGRGMGPRQGGISDADPTDPPGQGRGRARPPAPQREASDSDPTDPPGQGRGRLKPA
ncbi:MAG: hypothetical protein N2588_09115 [Rhodovarius sp.]|nr:hypothetical protein [Rhodovarius sp.]